MRILVLEEVAIGDSGDRSIGHTIEEICRPRCRDLNFRGAAEQLNLTRPALNQHIRRLEQEIGMALFERNCRGVALTATGAELSNESSK